MSPIANATAVLLSGGLDSAILTGQLCSQGRGVRPLYIDCGLVWQGAELNATRRFLAAIARPNLAPLTVLAMPVADLYTGHWSLTGQGTPDASSADAAVYLPGRNALLLVKAAVWCRLNNIHRLVLAPLASNPFADATEAFFEKFEQAMNIALGGELRIDCPFGGLHKRDAMRLGRGLPLELTFSCIAPVGELHCGRCNKCAERQAAFRDAEFDDRTTYARHL